MVILSNHPSFEILKPTYWRSSDSCRIGQHSRAILTDSRSPHFFFSDTLLLRWKLNTVHVCLSLKERSREGQEMIFKDLNVFHLGICFPVDIFRFWAWASCRKQDDTAAVPSTSQWSLPTKLGGPGNSEPVTPAWERIGSRWPCGRVRC